MRTVEDYEPVYSNLEKQIESLNNKLELSTLEETFYIRGLTQDEMVIEFDRTMKQFTVYNPTAAVIYLSTSPVAVGSYMFTVGANRFLIAPPFLFERLYILQTGFSAAMILAHLTAHTKTLLSPGNYTV